MRKPLPLTSAVKKKEGKSQLLNKTKLTSQILSVGP